jgi:hypothetical protein
MPQVPYEIADKDNRFLEEASKLVGINLSHLDLCHHRVILTLKKSCNDLNSEQIGKLAVMLLNCQSGSEGRKIFKCTEEMSLKQCTTEMDPDTWNAYHLVTNRAKAVCASVRQEQFRGLTELTVNKLMNTAHDQIKMMQELSEGQKHLHEMTDSAMGELSDKNTKLLDQQHNRREFPGVGEGTWSDPVGPAASGYFVGRFACKVGRRAEAARFANTAFENQPCLVVGRP